MNKRRAEDALRILREQGIEREDQLTAYAAIFAHECDEEDDAERPVINSFCVCRSLSYRKNKNFTKPELRRL